MKKISFCNRARAMLFWLISLTGLPLWAQHLYTTSSGYVQFQSETLVTTIVGHNRRAEGSIDLAAGAVYISFDMRDFHFESRLMGEHFRNDFLHVDQFPQASFRGSFPPFESDRADAERTRRVEATGYMTLHGVSRKMKITGMVRQNAGGVSVGAEFPLVLSDFNIQIPSILQVKIARTVTVSASISFTRIAKP